jgi:copper chaperone CopZ
MKQLIVFIAIICSSLIVFAQQDKDIATEKYKVDGNCNMCKKRIENAAHIKGVKRAEWDKETQQLTVVYKSSKTSSQDILSAIAKAGHSSEKVQATETDYENLPECCHYKTNTCNH